jgi:hypothetical protein
LEPGAQAGGIRDLVDALLDVVRVQELPHELELARRNVLGVSVVHGLLKITDDLS